MTGREIDPRRSWPVVFAALAGLAVTGGADAQGVRGQAVTTARYVEIRPIALDSVPRSEVNELPNGRLEFEGRPVTCRGDVCTFHRSRPAEAAVALTQDVRMTGWGLGLEGLSASLHVRGRDDVGSEFVWPRTDDAFDVLEGYLQFVEGPLRARAGRLRLATGLGFGSYDGASVQVTPIEELRLEAYVGRSLARGLSEPRHEALRGAGTFFPDRNAWLVGGAVGAEPVPGTALTARYQREIWTDLSGLVSERASLDARSDVLHPIRLVGSLDWDFAFGRVGKAHLGARLPLAEGRVSLEVTGRRYVPYFELWTIWGFFDPVAYHEGDVRVSWAPDARTALWVEGGYRFYGDADTEPIFGPVEDDAWRAGAGGSLRPSDAWRLSGSYRIERGAGAFLSSGQADARWRPVDRLWVAAHASASQQIEEFRIGEGVVLGGGGSAGFELTDRVELSLGAALYRQTFEDRPGAVDWNQVRAWSALRVAIGSDPGLERWGER